MRIPSVPWRVPVVAVALVALVGGGATAAGQFDARNADKVDGHHAVGAAATAAQRAGKLVAAGSNGRLPAGAMAKAPDAARLDGRPASKLRWQTIAPQSVAVTGTATKGSWGPTLSSSGDGGFVVGFVVPPTHDPADPLRVRMTYLDSDTGACTWSAYTAGLQGPDAPPDQSDVHNGFWRLPGDDDGEGPVSVQAGQGSVQRATLTWPFQDTPGTFLQLNVSRWGGDVADTCNAVTVVGLELLW
jgi:hypothetical protein